MKYNDIYDTISPNKEGDTMNKYDKEILQQEVRQNQRERQIKNKTILNIKRRMYELYPTVSEIMSIDNENLFNILMHCINCFDDETISIVLEELQRSNHRKTSTLWSLLRSFNNSLLTGDEETLKNIIESAKILGCAKDITLKEENTYKLITPNDNVVLFTQCYDNVSDATTVQNKCHGVTRACLMARGETHDCIAVVSKMPTHFNNLIYHSYIIQNNKVFDISMNLVMGRDNYHKLFGPQPIATFTKQEFDDTLEQLENEDEDFSNANIDELLKCAMAKQMKKERRYHL